MKITTTVEIPPRRIADLMATAIEGGIGYWCKGVFLNNMRKSTDHIGPWYDDEALYDEELSIEVIELDPSSDKNSSGRWVLGLVSMERAFVLMQEFGKPKGWHWQNFITENDDAETADVWFQLAVFGEVVYG